MFNACVLSLLLNGSECWTSLQRDLQRLSVFHRRCIRSIMGVSHQECWDDHITNHQLRVRWGDPDTIRTKVEYYRLEWLGHVARMEEHRLPKQVFFGTLPSRRPAHAPRRRWKDCIMSDLRSRGLEGEWRAECESRSTWRSAYSAPVDAQHPPPPPPVTCYTCDRQFARTSDRTRHKCKAERAKPVKEQKGACQCGECGRWLKSRGGLARHKCTYPQSAAGAPLPASPLCCIAHCQACDRCFASTRGCARHRCSRTCSRPTIQDRQGFTCVCACSRRFRLPHHLDRHRAVCSSSLSAAPPGPTKPSWQWLNRTGMCECVCVCVCARV